jgi:transposase
VPKRHPTYPPEVRAEAVRLVRAGGRNPEELSRDLGCSAQAIRTWVKQAKRDEGHRHDGLPGSEREEPRRLRAENRVLRMEREPLKTAPAFFARATEPSR